MPLHSLGGSAQLELERRRLAERAEATSATGSSALLEAGHPGLPSDALLGQTDATHHRLHIGLPESAQADRRRIHRSHVKTEVPPPRNANEMLLGEPSRRL